MTQYFQTITMTYLLYPILGVLLIVIGLIVAKKNALLGNKHLIGYSLAVILVLTVPALSGFMDYSFMPYGYIGLAVLYLILGRYSIRLISWVFKGGYKYRHELLLTLFLTVVGMLFFALIFNLCNELQYGWLASTCMIPFVLISVFIQSYTLYMNIPLPVYRVWQYADSTVAADDSNLDYSRMAVLTLEIYKQEPDTDVTRINAKVAEDMPFGEWFKRLISDYNMKYPLSPIDNYASESNGGWIFYYKPSFFVPRRYIDYTKSFRENKIKQRGYTIIAKRVKEEYTEQ